MQARRDILDELFFRKPVRRHVAEFGALMALIALLIAGYALYRGRGIELVFPLFVAALLLVVAGYHFPRVLHPVWKAWMRFAEAIGTVMSGVVLFVSWYAMIVPVGVVLRICGVEVMDMSFRKPVASYWIERQEKQHSFKLLERQF